MNRIPQDESAAEPREVLQVTLNGGEEIAAATALTCMGLQFLMFTHAATNDRADKAQQCLQNAGELAEKVLALIPAAVVKRVHAFYHTAREQH